MPDPNLTSTNCDGETSTVQLGNDLANVEPNKRFGIVKHDHRTIENNDALTAPGNGGDLPGGLQVNLCAEDAEQPWAGRVTGNPGTNALVGTAPPTGTNPVNALRMQIGASGEYCGLMVAPPKFTAIGNFPRVNINDNPNPAPNGVAQDGPKIGTLILTNPDTVKRLFRIKGRFSMITQMVADNADTLLSLIYRSRVNDNPANHLALTGLVPFVGGAALALNSRVVTMGYPQGPYEGHPLNDMRDFVDEVILDPGVTRYLHFYSSTIRNLNVFTAASTTPDRGVNAVGISIEESYAVGGA